ADPSVTAVLDELELEMAAITAGRRDRREASTIESEARTVLRRTTKASDTNRAEILVRRAGRMTGHAPSASGTDPSAVTFPGNLIAPLTSSTGFVSLAQFLSPGMSGPDGPQYNLPGPPPLVMPSPPPTSSLPPFYPYAPPAPRHYISLDALGWWVKGDQLPAL